MAKGAARRDSAGRLDLENFEDEIDLDPAVLGPSLSPDEVGRVAHELLSSNVLQSRWLSSAGKSVPVFHGMGEMKARARELLHLKSGRSSAEVLSELNDAIPPRPLAQIPFADRPSGWDPPGTARPRRRRQKPRDPAVERAIACHKSLRNASARAIRQAIREGRVLVFKPTQSGYEVVGPENFPRKLAPAEQKTLRFVLTRDLPNSLLRVPEPSLSTGPRGLIINNMISNLAKDIQKLAEFGLPTPKMADLFWYFKERDYPDLTMGQFKAARRKANVERWKRGGNTRRPLSECLPDSWKK